MVGGVNFDGGRLRNEAWGPKALAEPSQTQHH